jgi:urate oxidase
MLGLDRLLEVCSSPIWAQRVLAGGPFSDVEALLQHADRVLAELPDAEIDAALEGHPRKHHFRYDLSRFGLENNNEVFHADDRPYGLIQAIVTRDDAPSARPAWDRQLVP